MTLVDCPGCGGRHPAGTTHCPVDGSPLPRPRKPAAPPADEARTEGGPGPEAGPGPGPAAEPATGSPVALVLVAGDGWVVPVPAGEPLRLGREASPIAGLCTDNISRHHADVQEISGRVVVVDRGSANGTFLGEERLRPDVPRPIGPGDVIRLASDPPLRLRVDAAGAE